jgi:hypothetical protein
MAGSRGGGGWGIRDNLGVRVDDGLAEPCTKRLWTSTIASYVVVEIFIHCLHVLILWLDSRLI